MNLAQSPIIPAPSPWFVPYPIVPPPEPPDLDPAVPAPGSYRMRVLQLLDKIGGNIAFGKASEGALFWEIHEAIGGEDTLGATLHRMRKKGFIESSGGLNRTRYRLTARGRRAVAELSGD